MADAEMIRCAIRVGISLRDDGEAFPHDDGCKDCERAIEAEVARLLQRQGHKENKEPSHA